MRGTRGGKVEKTCPTCGGKFLVPASAAMRRKYCSMICAYPRMGQPKERTGKKVERACPICGRIFTVFAYLSKQGRGKYCSRQCGYEGRKKSERNRFLRASGRKTCAQCGKVFPVFPGDVLRRKYCSPACKGEAHAQEVAKKPLKRPSAMRKADFEWRRAVLERDGHQCRRCGKRGNHAHHIALRTRRPDLRHDINNGLCLCLDCHSWAHGHPLEAEAEGIIAEGRYELERLQQRGARV